MTREEAIRLLDPETTADAIAEIEYYHGFSGREAAIAAITDACSIAVKALREKPVEHAHWKPFIEDVEIYNSGGFTEKRQTGWFCSKCGKGFTEFGHQQYCSNCGAQMDEEENR